MIYKKSETHLIVFCEPHDVLVIPIHPNGYNSFDELSTVIEPFNVENREEFENFDLLIALSKTDGQSRGVVFEQTDQLLKEINAALRT